LIIIFHVISLVPLYMSHLQSFSIFRLPYPSSYSHVNAGSFHFQSLESEDLASNTNSIAFVRESRYNTANELTIPIDLVSYASYTPLSPPCDFTTTVQICYSTGS
jgi:hypothetical protein